MWDVKRKGSWDGVARPAQDDSIPVQSSKCPKPYFMCQIHNLCSFVLHKMAGAESSFSQLQSFFDTLLFGCTIIWERLSMLSKISPVTEQLYEIINNTPKNDGVLTSSGREKTRTHKFKPQTNSSRSIYFAVTSLGKVGFNFPTCLLFETLLHTVHITSNSTPSFEKQHLMLCCERSVNLFATKEPQFTILLEIWPPQNGRHKYLPNSGEIQLY